MIIVALVAVVGVLLLDRYMGEEEGKKGSEPFSETSTEATAEDGEKKRALTPFPVTTPADGKTSVAVLPFINMSDDQQNEYFSDGISEELLNVLVRIKDLRVPSRTSSFTFKGSDKKVTDIGRELQVDHVLEGSVRKAGDRIRVTAQLIDVRTDTHLWSDTYTRQLDDIFASFLEAVEIDPQYDQAWAALADTYTVLPEYEFGTAEAYIPIAREAIQKALSINPDSAHALAASGIIKAQYDFDWDGANADLLKAIKLEPGRATVHQWYGDILMPQGRTEEALEQLRIAALADPVSIAIRHTPGYFNLWTGRFEEAEEIYMRLLAINPDWRWTYQNLDMLYTMRGEYDNAREWATKLAEMEGYDPAPDLARIDAVEDPALKPRALELLEQRTDIVEGVWGKAMQYALMDEYELALVSLEKAFETESPWRVHMKWVVNYKPLHDSPRYQALLKKMNLLP